MPIKINPEYSLDTDGSCIENSFCYLNSFDVIMASIITTGSATFAPPVRTEIRLRHIDLQGFVQIHTPAVTNYGAAGISSVRVLPITTDKFLLVYITGNSLKTRICTLTTPGTINVGTEGTITSDQADWNGSFGAGVVNNTTAIIAQIENTTRPVSGRRASKYHALNIDLIGDAVSVTNSGYIDDPDSYTYGVDGWGTWMIDVQVDTTDSAIVIWAGDPIAIAGADSGAGQSKAITNITTTPAISSSSTIIIPADVPGGVWEAYDNLAFHFVEKIEDNKIVSVWQTHDYDTDDFLIRVVTLSRSGSTISVLDSLNVTDAQGGGGYDSIPTIAKISSDTYYLLFSEDGDPGGYATIIELNIPSSGTITKVSTSKLNSYTVPDYPWLWATAIEGDPLTNNYIAAAKWNFTDVPPYWPTTEVTYLYASYVTYLAQLPNFPGVWQDGIAQSFNMFNTYDIYNSIGTHMYNDPFMRLSSYFTGGGDNWNSYNHTYYHSYKSTEILNYAVSYSLSKAIHFYKDKYENIRNLVWV